MMLPGNPVRGNGRGSMAGMGLPKLPYRGGRGDGGRGMRGGFNRDRLAPRGWSPSQRGDYSGGRPSNVDHFGSGGRNGRPNMGGPPPPPSSSSQKDRKMKMGPRHIRSSMDQ